MSLLSNGALKFSRVTLGDAGTYQCLAKNEAGAAVGRTKLVLHGNVALRSYRKRCSQLYIYRQKYRYITAPACLCSLGCRAPCTVSNKVKLFSLSFFPFVFRVSPPCAERPPYGVHLGAWTTRQPGVCG